MKGYIYQIINKIDGKRYVGQTIDLQKRKQSHFSELKRNCHPNYLLQDAWNKWGEENFMFVYEEIENATPDILNQKEIDTIAQFDSFNNGYNRTPGGQGGPIRRKLSYENFCFIYYGCQWSGMTEKVAEYLGIDSSTVSSILREKAHLDYLVKSHELTNEEILKIKQDFRKAFSIPYDKPEDDERVSYHLTEDEYFYCFCVSSTYGRGIDTALANFFNKHKSFLFNGLKIGKNGVIHKAHERFLLLTNEEVLSIGKEKFKEWEIDKYTKILIKEKPNNRWRQ